MALRAVSKILLVAILVSSTSGCSFAMQKPPETIARPDQPVRCDSSSTSPTLDAICALIFLPAAVRLALSKTCEDNPFDPNCVDRGARNGAAAVSAGLGVLCGVAAARGFGAAGRCQEVKNTNARCITGDEAACQRLNSAWTPTMRLPAAQPPGGWAPPAAPATAAPDGAPPAEPGCAKDVDCKGDRVCVGGACVDPPAKARP